MPRESTASSAIRGETTAAAKKTSTAKELMNNAKGPVMIIMAHQLEGKGSTSELKVIHSEPKRSKSKPDSVEQRLQGPTKQHGDDSCQKD